MVLPDTKTEMILLDDGNIQLKFVAVADGADLFCILTPQQAASLAASLLTSVGASFNLTGPDFSPSPGPLKVDALVEAHHWSFGHTGSQNQKAAVLHVGNATIGVPVNDDRLREFGRAFVNASWKVRTSTRLRSLLYVLLKEFGDDLRAWCVLLASQLSATIRERGARLKLAFGYPKLEVRVDESREVARKRIAGILAAFCHCHGHKL